MFRKKTPVILQMEMTECGAAALSIILAYYGKYISAEEARYKCGVSRDGSSAINIIKAARSYGMNAKGFNIDLEEIKSTNTPFIAYWNFNHFIVVEGCTKKYVYVNDPAIGRVNLTWQEFDQGFTGIILEMTPAENFIADGKPIPSTVKLLNKRLVNNYKELFFIISLTFLLIFPNALTPLMSKLFIDNILIQEQYSLFIYIIIGLVFSTFLSVFMSWYREKYTNLLTVKLEVDNTIEFLWKLLHLPMRFFQQRSIGDIVQRQEISEEIASTLSTSLPKALVSLIEIALFSLILYLLSSLIASSVILLMLINIAILKLNKRFMTDMSRRLAQDQGKLSGIEVSVISIIETIKLGAFENFFFRQLASQYIKTMNTEQHIMFREMLLDAMPKFVNLAITLTILCLGSYQVIQGSLTVGSIIAIQALALQLNEPLESFLSFITEVNKIRANLLRLYDATESKLDQTFIPYSKCIEIKDKSKITVKIKMLTYSHSPVSFPVIHNVNLDIGEEKKIALVGKSGCGKSTLAQLICGFHDDYQGEILLNNVPLKRIGRKQLSEIIAYVDQKKFFFEGDLMSNLTFWDKDIDPEYVNYVLNLVGMDKVVLNRGGINLKVLENGSNFSTGQCQRLELARALLTRPKLLILDEATSALDMNMEKRVYKNLDTLSCKKVIISHRLKSIQDCDKIYFLENGKIIEQGTHDELFALKGDYYNHFVMEEVNN